MHQRSSLALILLMMSTGWLVGCVSLLFGPPKVKSDEYVLEAPPAPWGKIDPGTSDMAFQHPADRGTISVNSVCDQYQDLSLDELTASLMLGLDDAKVQAVDKLEIDGYPALRTTVSGLSGNSEVTVCYTVLRSPRCVYDFILVARTPAFAGNQRSYVDFVQRFHERRKP